MKKWKVIKSEDISPSKWLPVRKDLVKVKKDQVIDYYYVNMQKAVSIIPITRNKEIVMVKQYKHGARDIIVELPAGMIEKDESAEQAAIRECEEETGIKISSEQLEYIGENILSSSKNTLKSKCYVAFDLEFNSEQKLDNTEDIEVVTMSKDKVLNMIKKGKIISSDTIAFIFMLQLNYPKFF